jgi:release factor glutamine methyltransferase
MGHVSFCGRPLLTRPGCVMTPRVATERLVEEALAYIGDAPARVVDVGTGSGAIAIAVAAASQRAQVFATDSSASAVALARANVRNNGLEDRVTVLHGDLLAPVPGSIDVVVANLPYLPTSEAGRYPDLVGEPSDAVFSFGDGLDPYRRLLTACEERLSDDGAVFLQLHRRVLGARRCELPALRAVLEPQLAAA